MDFSNLLTKEIDLKRKRAKSGLILKRKRLLERKNGDLEPVSTDSLPLDQETTFANEEGEQVPNEVTSSEKLDIEERNSEEFLVPVDIYVAGKEKEKEKDGKDNKVINNENDEKTEKDKVDVSSLNSAESTKTALNETIIPLSLPTTNTSKKSQYNEYLSRENSVTIVVLSEDILNQECDKLALQVRKFLKEILNTWQSNCNEQYPTGVLLETKRDLVKLMYKLRSGKVDSEVMISLATIVHYIQTEHFIKASESYLQLSIGNVAWPIGVRDVGIHARAADAKISGDDKLKLSNIMKSESTRRWLVAIKRLINYCETIYKSKKGLLC